MQMAGDLARRRAGGGLMAERQRAERQRRGRHAADIPRRLGIVIAGDPDPVAAALQRRSVARSLVADARRPPPSWKLSPSAITARGA